MQLQSIFCAAVRNLSVTDSILIRADDAYFVGEIYTLYELGVWFFSGKGLLSIDSAFQ